jgi:hypothetical protein
MVSLEKRTSTGALLPVTHTAPINDRMDCREARNAVAGQGSHLNIGLKVGLVRVSYGIYHADNITFIKAWLVIII